MAASGFPQQYGHQFQGNSSPTAGAPWDFAAFPAPQHPQSVSRSHSRPPPGQARDHAGVLQDSLQDAMFPLVNATGNRQPNEGAEDIPPPPPVENIATQAQQQDLQYFDMGNYDMVNDYPQLQGHRDHVIGDNARIVQDDPAQAHVAPPAPEIDAFNFEVLEARAGPSPAFLDELPYHPVRNGRASEFLRQRALRYLQDRNSQVAGIRMDPGEADGVMVVIAVRLTNL